MLAIDYSFWEPDYPTVKAAGYDAVIGYFSHDLAKSLTQAKVQRAHAAGLGVGAIFEDTAQRALGGAAAGQADGIYANAYADSIGWPKWKPIGYAIDFEPTPEQIPTVIAYVQAAAQQGRVAYGYGDSDVIDALVAAGIPDDWQTCAWSRGVVNNKAALYQRLRPTTSLQGSFDEDVVLHPSNDLWFPGDVDPAQPQPVNPLPPTVPASAAIVRRDATSEMTLLERHSSGAWYTLPTTLAYKHHVVSPAALALMQKRTDLYATLGLDDADIEAIPDA